jgi:hypothetical protein
MLLNAPVVEATFRNFFHDPIDPTLFVRAAERWNGIGFCGYI